MSFNIEGNLPRAADLCPATSRSTEPARERGARGRCSRGKHSFHVAKRRARSRIAARRFPSPRKRPNEARKRADSSQRFQKGL